MVFRSVILKSRHPKKGVGYEPLGIEMNPEKELRTTMGPMGKQLGIPEQG